MGKVKTQLMKDTMDDMGDIADEFITEKQINEARRAWILEQYSFKELKAELERRGFKVIKI